MIVRTARSPFPGQTKKSRIYALGYGRWKDLEGFINLLRSLEVSMLVDVRRFPRSRNPQFMMENLKTELLKVGMGYEYLGKSLGGFRRGGYERYMQTSQYEDGIRRLLEISQENTVAIMCLEPKSKYCHRRFIVQTLLKLGAEVILIE